jgi:hypothetical protein
MLLWDLQKEASDVDPGGPRDSMTTKSVDKGEEVAGSPTMVLAVGALEAGAAPPGHGEQYFLLDLVHWLLGHPIPGGGGLLSDSGVSLQGLGKWLSLPTHMTLTLWQSGSSCGHGCCEWMRNFSVLQAATKVTSLDFW